MNYLRHCRVCGRLHCVYIAFISLYYDCGTALAYWLMLHVVALHLQPLHAFGYDSSCPLASP